MEIESRMLASELRKDLPKLDLHGLRRDEIQNRIDQFLYEQFNKDEFSAEIIFGIGKGILREEGLNFLQNHPLVGKVIDKGVRCIVLLEK